MVLFGLLVLWISVAYCSGKYYGPWSDCSVSCGGGYKSRIVSSGGAGEVSIRTRESSSCNAQLCEDIGKLEAVRGKLIASGLTIEKEYSVSFTFAAYKFSPGWHNILHFTTGDDLGSPGSRIPAVWTHMSEGDVKAKPLLICSDVNGNSNYCWTSRPIPVNTFTQIQIRQISSSRGYTYQILIDGEVQHEVINTRPLVFRDVKLYASDPWHAAVEGEINNLEYSKAALNIERGKLIEPGMTIGKEYSVSFKLFANKFSPGWHNVLHFTNGASFGTPGQRIPAVWLHMSEGGRDEKPLYICTYMNNNADYCFTSSPIILFKWTPIEIKQFSSDVGYKYQILINGKVEHEVVNKNPRVFNNVNLYVSHSKYKAQNGEIKDLKYSGAKRWVEVELKGQKGGETVEVYKDQGNDSPSYRKMSLPKFWGRKFTYPVRESVRVFFYKRHPDEVVQLRHPELYHITYGQEPAEWDCNLRFKKDASFDKSCVDIDQGIFRWEGSYVLEKKYQNMNEDDKSTFTIVHGAICPDNYKPLTTSWQACKEAAESLGYEGASVAHVSYLYKWGKNRPQGCFRSKGNGRIHFNTGQGGHFQGTDAILCIREDDVPSIEKEE